MQEEVHISPVLLTIESKIRVSTKCVMNFAEDLNLNLTELIRNAINKMNSAADRLQLSACKAIVDRNRIRILVFRLFFFLCLYFISDTIKKYVYVMYLLYGAESAVLSLYSN